MKMNWNQWRNRENKGTVSNASEIIADEPAIAGIRKYTISELHAVKADDRHAVRDECLRRHKSAIKRFTRAKIEVDHLEALLLEVM